MTVWEKRLPGIGLCLAIALVAWFVVELLPVLTSSSGDLSVNNFCPVLAEGEDWTRIWDKIQADTPFALSSSMWFPVAGEE